MKKITIRTASKIGVGFFTVLVVLSGCQSKTIKSDQVNDNASTSQIAVGEPNPATSDIVEDHAEAPDHGFTASKLITYLGQSELELIALLDENPEIIDEGGRAFQKAGIRVWFDDGAKVSQVFTQRKDFEIEGLVLGDPIEAFEEAIGQASVKYSSDWHFAYEGKFVSLIFDETSRETQAVYILNEDF